MILDLYLKKIIGTRAKLTAASINVSNYWLRFVDRSDFSEKILPALQRALLRSPENVLESIAYMFEDIKIDLSDFAKDIVSTLCKQLIVKTEQTQSDAVQCMKSFVKQCSSTEAIEYILKHSFAILNGRNKTKLNFRLVIYTILNDLKIWLEIKYFIEYLNFI